MKLIDRITQKEISSLPERIYMGRYIFIGTENTSINQIQCENDEMYYFVPDREFQFSLLSNSKEFYSHFSKENSFLIQKEIQKNLEDIANEFIDKKEWNEMIQVIPLIRNIGKLLDIYNFEKQLKEWLFHLQEICIKPEVKLIRTSEKMPVSRAKRVPLRAIHYLSSHSEDWERRKFRSVVPKFIIAEKLEDEISIYENIVTARLIDHLLYYIQTRINGIKRINRFQKAIEKILEDYSSGDNNRKKWYKKIERTFQLCGEAYIEESTRKDKNSTLDFLFKIESELLKLLNSKLYKSISKQYQIGRTLRKTNLLSNHKHYKYVPYLWEKWLLADRKESNQERFDSLQNQNTKFFQFCKLVIYRALVQLKFTIQENTGTQMTFESKIYTWTKIQIEELEYEIIEISINNIIYQLVPILENIDISKERIPDKTVLVHYNKENNTSQNSQLFISPEDVNSIEIIARWIRQKLLEEVLIYYPAKLDLGIDSLENDLKKIQGMEIKEESKKKKLVFRELIPIKEFEPIFQKAKQNLKSYGKQKENEIQKIDNYKKEIKQKLNEIQNYFYHCLHCDNSRSNFSDFQLRDNDCFLFKCKSCDCEWGIEIKDKKRTPFFRVKNYKEIEQSIESLGMDWT